MNKELLPILPVKKKKRFNILSWKTTMQLSLMSLPGVLWYIIFAYIPMFGIIIAFKNFNYAQGVFGSEWCGFENFIYLFKSNDAIRLLRNTFLYNIAFIIADNLLALAVALLLNNLVKKWQVKLYQTAFFIPYFISWIVVAYISQALFSHEFGIANYIANAFGANSVTWFTNTKPWPIILVIFQTWKQLGFKTLVYYGSIIGIDISIYEAASIDGANSWQSIRRITLPLLKPTIIVLFILAVGAAMRSDFGLFYYVPNNQGALYEATDVLDTYVYRVMKVLGDFSVSSAVSVFQSVIGLLMVLGANKIVKMIDAENAMF